MTNHLFSSRKCQGSDAQALWCCEFPGHPGIPWEFEPRYDPRTTWCQVSNVFLASFTSILTTVLSPSPHVFFYFYGF